MKFAQFVGSGAWNQEEGQDKWPDIPMSGGHEVCLLHVWRTEDHSGQARRTLELECPAT